MKMSAYKISDNFNGVEGSKVMSPHHSHPINGVRPSDSNVYDLDFIEMEAQRKGFPGKYVPDSVFGDSYTKYDNRDKDVANKAMPKLNDCLKKARKTAK